VRNIPPNTLKHLAMAFDIFSSRDLMAFPEINQDTVRAEIDSTISNTLGLPNLQLLRDTLAREPILCLSLESLLPA
jgi:hypothetical protein